MSYFALKLVQLNVGIPLKMCFKSQSHLKVKVTQKDQNEEMILCKFFCDLCVMHLH